PAGGAGLLAALRGHRHRAGRRDDRRARRLAGGGHLPGMGGPCGARRAGRDPGDHHAAGFRRLPHPRCGGDRMSPSHRARRRGGGVVVILGELLLTLGALLLLFLVWQLWWTDVVADREQAGILDGLEQEWGEVDAQTVAPRQEGPPPVPPTPE